MNSVILTGFMGTGKSSVGTVLAQSLGYRFVDLDALIVAETGTTINEIFTRHGESFFRSIESAMVKRLTNESHLVVSTGGGVVLDPENRRLLRSTGNVVNLTATPETIRQRLLSESDRPLMKNGKSLEKITAMLAEREQCYADADIRIDTTGKKVEDIVAEILIWLKKDC